jgi:beta-glucosidase
MVYDHHSFDNYLDATVAALKSGNDMMMSSAIFFDNAVKAVKEGLVEEEIINQACRRILKVKFQLGLFDEDFEVKSTEGIIGCEEHSQVALESALSSIILLKNDNNTLPLNIKNINSIAVIGPNANNVTNQLGDWTTGARFHPNEPQPRERIKTVLDAVKERFEGSNAKVYYSKGCDSINHNKTDPQEFNEAVEMAQKSDVTIVVLGEPMEWIGEERDRANLDLPKSQRKLLKAIHKTGTTVILVMLCSKPNTIPWAVNNIPSILVSFNPGQAGGSAIASTIFGDSNPSGKLTVSWPKHVGQIPVFYNHLPGWHTTQYVDMDAKPQWPFGYGLSYTNYSYNKMDLNKTKFTRSDTLQLKVTLENTGANDGTEIVQVYIRDLVSSATVPVLQLKAFQRVPIKAGETKDIELEIPINQLGLINENLDYVVESGEFLVFVGPNSQDLVLKEKITVVDE